MERLRIIVHGERANSPLLRQVVLKLREVDRFHVDVRPTWEPGDALALAAEACALGVDALVAAGGDGMLHEVVNGIARLSERPSLGLIPLGTANDFACTANIDPNDPDRIASILLGDAIPVDIVQVGDRFFANVATGGFAVSSERTVPEGLKSVFGGLAYLLSGVANLASANAQSVEVRGPDFEWSGAFYGFAIANARCAGGGHRVSPDALVDDGLLDTVVVPSDESIFQTIRIGEGLTVEADEQYALRWRSSWVEVEGEDLRLNLDGEPYKIGGRVRFEVHPGHVQAHVPTGTAMLSPGP